MAGHFPKKGERKVNGVWVMPEAAPEPAPKVRRTMTAAERRDWLRKRAGWPLLKSIERKTIWET